MKNKLLKIALCCMALGTMAIPAYAAEEVKSVYVSIVPDDDQTFSPGEVEAGMEPTVDSGCYYVDEYDTSKSSYTPKTSYTYTITILPESGYKFTNSTKVSVYGATNVTVKSRSSSKIEVKAKTYPFYVLAEPTNIVIDETEKEATWDKVEHASKYNVEIYYTNKSGDEKQTKKSTKKASIDLSGYLGKYEDVHISVQAVKGTSDGDDFISNSDYVFADGSTDEDMSEEEYIFDIPTSASDGSKTSSTNSSNHSSSNGPSSNSSSGPSVGPSSNTSDGWHGSGDNWYYSKDGKKIVGWLGLNNDWYLLDSNGNMKYGWQYVDNNWFYMNTAHDGSFGKMLVGWQNINGKWYYLNTAHDGTYGAMYSNRTTPDGFKVGSDGAWIQ